MRRLRSVFRSAKRRYAITFRISLTSSVFGPALRQWSSHTTTASGRQSWGWKSQPQKGTKTIFDFVFVPFFGSEFPLENQMMNRMTVFAIALAVALMITGCNFHKPSATNEGANHAAPAKPEAPKPAAPAQAGELQPGQASGT